MKLKIMICLVGILSSVPELSTYGIAAGAEATSTIQRAQGVAAEAQVSFSPNERFKKVTVIAIPCFSFLELRPERLGALPHIRKLTELGAIGGMNIRTAARSMRDVYSSLGAGEALTGLPELQALEAEDMRLGVRATQLRERYMGPAQEDVLGAAAAGALLVPDLPKLKRLNQDQLYGAGMLGDLLKGYGIRRTVLGSSDLDQGAHVEFKQLRRYAPLMLIDSNGIVDNGTLGDEATAAAVDRPYGMRTDYAQLLQLWKKRMPSSFTLIELGDLYRLNADKSHYDTDRWEELKGKVLQEIDAFLGQLMEEVQTDQDSLWVFSPEVSSEAAREKAYLSPLIHYTGESGMLVSESTRRKGVVTFQDWTSSLLDEFKIPQPPGLSGIPLAASSATGGLAELLLDQNSMRMIYRSRPYLLYPFATYEMFVLLGSLLYAVWLRRRGESLGQFSGYGLIRTLLLSLLTAPAVMLVLGWAAAPLTAIAGIPAAMAMLVTYFVLGSLALALLLQNCTETKAMMGIGLGLAGIITLDTFTGAQAMKYSVLGYDPMIGARYYGIGNEYMGVLIGALVLGVTAALQRRHAAGGAVRRGAGAAAGTAFLLVTAALAAPSLGANAGGALSAAVAFGIAGVQCFAGSRWRELNLGRGTALLTVLLALGVGALWLLNSADSPAAFARESHVGRAFHALREGRFDQIGHLIVRKLRMNVHLLRASAWSKVLLTSLFVMAVLVLRPRGRLRVWQHENPYWMYGFSANMIGAIAALLLNDSGIVAAATMIVFVAVPMLLLRLRELAPSS
ncbi:hypothetical protein ACFPES_06305 [Paenibacillus sp. GCM10023248]|uniref:hypothetical protein n=1 Tax=unclassified Paenibacillus TaxID=185978 RepID=UPI002378BF6B|nr:hypothetical protein [Paenibacillus sp. MAHUQ-63]MDD9266641.1 hypothetical protein [Paenibacillus sp. MAHUQ-63]